MRNLRPTAAQLTWGSLLIVVTFLSLVSLTATSQEAIAQPTERHATLHFSGAGVAAHRGAPTLAPENTLASVREALDTGNDFIEIDVRLTLDGVPVLMHDRTVDRTTNGTGSLDTLAWSEVRLLDAGAWFSEAFAGERVPSLAQFLELVAPFDQSIFIELKDDWTDEQAEAVTELIDAHHLSDRVAVLSFSAETLQAIARVHDNLARVWLIRKFDDQTITRVAELGVNGVGARLLMYERYPVMSKQLGSIGVVSLSYTLNDMSAWKRARLLGVDIVVTDRAQALREWAGDEAINSPARSMRYDA